MLRDRMCHIILAAAGFSVFAAADLSAAQRSFGLSDVVKRAEQLAKSPYQAQDNQLPDFLKNIGYDEWRDLRFKDSRSLWSNEQVPFKVRFFHPGFIYHQPVIVHSVDPAG